MFATYLSAVLNVSTIICFTQEPTKEFLVFNNSVRIFAQNKNLRWINFCANSLVIDEFNKKAEYKFKLGPNDNTGKSYEQYLSTYLAYGKKINMKPSYHEGTADFTQLNGTELNEIITPTSLDLKKLIDKPVDQDTCGSCYAHAALSVMSAAYARKYNLTSVLLSVQYYLDCGLLSNLPNCLGGTVDDVMIFTNIWGSAFERDYPYNGNLMQCRHDELASQNKIKKNFIDDIYIYFGRNVSFIKQILIKYGPVVAPLAATDYIFQFYKEGVINRPCVDNDVNHYVTIVGYDQTDDGIEYWIVRNSMGLSWGEAGHFRIQMGLNLCGIESHVIAITSSSMRTFSIWSYTLLLIITLWPCSFIIVK